MLLYGRHVILRTSLDILQAHIAVLVVENTHKFREKTRTYRRTDANSNNTLLPAPDLPHVAFSTTQLFDGAARPQQEPFTCIGEPDTTLSTDEYRGSDLVFEVAYASADSSGVDPKIPRGTPNSPKLGRHDKIT